MILLMFSVNAIAQEDVNYDESKVPEYELPEILRSNSGKVIDEVSEWEQFRRPEILAAFEQYVYGKTPAVDIPVRFELMEESREALGGKAIRKQVRAYFGKFNNGPSMDILIYLPEISEKPVPIIVGLNFYGNHTIIDDQNIFIHNSWTRNSDNFGIKNNQVDEASRGIRNNRWPVNKIIDGGYGLATIYYGDLDPDLGDHWQDGIHPLFYRDNQEQPADDEWGSIGAWSWGLSRALDYFQTDNEIDHEHVAVMGHSRLGKTSLWAGAVDPRFAAVISNDSGCGGAALSRRRFGEKVARINNAFPHWFNNNFNRYNDQESYLPVDQHMLIALMAPRPVYIASAEDDRWADPKGEFLSGREANPAYQLYGLEGMPADQMPKVSQPIMGTIGYHIRPGGHDVTDYDWEQWMKFLNMHWKESKR